MLTTSKRHLEVYWKSPELLVVIDSEQFNGWQQLHDSYLNGYPDRSAMGFIEPGGHSSGRAFLAEFRTPVGRQVRLHQTWNQGSHTAIHSSPVP